MVSDTGPGIPAEQRAHIGRRRNGADRSAALADRDRGDLYHLPALPCHAAGRRDRFFSEFPRALVLATPSPAWLHSFAMESKEHMPWIASMLTTAVAFVAVRYRSRVLDDGGLALCQIAVHPRV
jgi:hypothetical protein